MTYPVLPQEFYQYVAKALIRQVEYLQIAVGASEEDFFRQLLRLITTASDVRRMLMQHDPQLHEMGMRIIEQDKFSDPDLETRKAGREELSTNFLDDVEIDPRDWILAQTLVLLGQASGGLPPEFEAHDLTMTFSREAVLAATRDRQAALEELEPSEDFTRRIVQIVDEHDRAMRAAAHATS